MIGLEFQILAAVGLDFLLGDPHGWPHPVRWIGGFAVRIEEPLRRAVPSARLAGVAAVVIVLAVTGFAAFAAVRLAGAIHPLLGDAMSILLLYTTLAARDLVRHSGDVRRALADGDLDEARRRVAQIVGRDTEQLDEAGIARATVESVAENTVDGVTAPLLFAAIGGPVGAMLYKAVNTLDSMFGYKNERYASFGWAAAKLDDVVNWIPARLTAPLVAPAAMILGLGTWDAWRIRGRDGRNTPSPNAGHTEAAMAGALGVQLGGEATYSGETVEKPTLGDAVGPIRAAHIARANALMLTTYALFLGLVLVARLFLVQILARGWPAS